MTLAVTKQEGRFARLEAIEWWDQTRLSAARVLVIGAGALGNEVIKNLALLGVGHVTIADMDRVELSNLSRSVLFRATDEGRFKAECAAEAAREIFPEIDVQAFVGNVLADLGLGWFRWAEVVIGALDNREARVFVNSACARVGRPWLDGGIEVLQGVVRGFAPPHTACYECTMGRVDWELLNKRRSCSLLARRALASRGTPTTPTTASIIAALQVQEVVKYLHGRPALLGAGIFFDGAEHNSHRVAYPVSPECPWHEPAAPIMDGFGFGQDTPLRVIVDASARQLGGLDAIDFSREIVHRLECPGCGHGAEVFRPAENVAESDVHCPRCAAECAPVFLHSLPARSPLLERTPRALGLPARDIVWARHGEKMLGWEMSADRNTSPHGLT